MAQLKDLIVNGASRFIGDIFGQNATFSGDLMPTSNGTQSLGDSTHQWKLYGTITGNADTATAVTQAASANTNAAYRILLSTSAADTEEQGSLNKDTDLRWNPSTSTLDIAASNNNGTITTTKGTMSLVSASSLYLNSGASASTIITRGGADNTHEVARFDTNGHFIPGSDKDHNVGSSSKRWDNVYADSYHSQVAAASTSGNSGFLLEDINGNMYGNLYLVAAGTTDKVGLSGLTLGNKFGSGTAANARGSLYLYGTSTTYTALQSALTGSTASTMYLPNHAGTGYLTHVADDDPVGSTSQPVYVAANGRIEAITGAIGNDTTGNAATATAADIITTANAVAYYSDTAGTFASKPSAQGALYATAADGALTFGTLPVAEGGTGVKSFTANRVVMSGSSTTAALTTRAVVNNTSSKAAAANTYIVTQNTLYNSQALINGAAQQRKVGIYAPTSAGTAGQVLVSSGSGAPTWGNNYELIWENPNHGNEFVGQTITLPSGTLNYGDLLFVILGLGVTNAITFIETSSLIYLYSSSGYGNVIYNPTYVEFVSGTTGYYLRTINIDVTDNTIDFSESTYTESSHSSVMANDHMIPHYIFKIRR